jgi:glycosyltransferase involved in cell wall biosynthesis
VVTGRDVVVLSSVDWRPLWQGPQEMASRFARSGNRVVFVENTGVRAPGLRDARRVLARLGRWGRALRSGGLEEVERDLYVCAPLIAPPFGSRLRRTLNRRLFLPLVARSLRRLGIRDPIVIACLPTDTARDLLAAFQTPGSVSIYYCAADFAGLTPHVAEIERTEREVVQASDFVLGLCPEIVQRCERWSAEVHLFPPAVDMAAFHPHVVPAKLPGPPVIGYVGGLHRYVDVSLVAELARRRPDWSWVFVGPVQTDCSELRELANVHLLGPKPHADLPALVAGFDVGLVPYVVSDDTATVTPTKVNEYLAMGKPVVATDLPALRDLGPHEGVLVSDARPDAFLEAIERGLAEAGDMLGAARRRRHAARSDWSARLNVITALIAAARPAASVTPRDDAAPAARRAAGAQSWA